MDYDPLAEQCSSQHYRQSHIAAFTEDNIDMIDKELDYRLKTSADESENIHDILELRFPIGLPTKLP